ncbi:MAG TPA: PP2C family protein-serine/threonine phosphatase [Thermoanaerobaculia bacterium]|jgi:serine phosphatase RsbU (regulator of sigma subunit)
MDLTWSIEDVVRSSDEDAVRRRFARRNRVCLAALMIFFTITGLIQLTDSAGHGEVLEVTVAALNLAFVAFGLFFMRYTRDDPPAETFTWRVGRWLHRRIHAAALVFVAVEYSFVLWYTDEADNWLGWVMTAPLMMLGFRMLVAELILLHGFLLGGGLVMMFTGRFPEKVPIYVGMLVINGICLAVELFASYRMRREVVSEWSSRRSQAREQIRMRDELRYARELQLSMLPECAPRLDWADICSVSVPATEVGGDYYDYFVEGDRIALVCGDVAGHGMASGLVLSALRSGFTLLRDSLGDPAAVLTRLHDLVTHTTRRRMFVTVSVVLLDRHARTATIASAGHPPVILRRADGTVETIALYAPPLGVRLKMEIPQRRLDVAPGDTFVLHSDGIYETLNAAGESYGIERLEQVVRDQGGVEAETLRDAILRDVASFRGAREPDDDVTVVVCRLT